MTLFRPLSLYLGQRCLLSKVQLLEPLRAVGYRQPLRSSRWCNMRGFKDRKRPSIMPLEAKPPPDAPLTLSCLTRPFLFTVGFSTATFVGCSIFLYERHRSIMIERRKGTPWTSWWGAREEKRPGWRQQCHDFWNGLSPGQKAFAPVLLANLAVFAAWRVPRWQNTMMVYFTSNPVARVVCWPMLLSTFSHYSLFHLAANMFVLHSFSHTYVGTLGREQAAALYLSAGVISSFASLALKTATRRPGPSLGASGAIMAVLGFFCTQYPDAQLSIILLPMWTFSAASAIKVAVSVDLAGCILGWRFFDHAAHLGGALFGICYGYFGASHIWPQREHIYKFWHSIRQPVDV